MKIRLFPARERGFFDHGWLVTHHSFSFANFYDPDLMGFGKLRVVNDDLIAPGAGFGTHSHTDMEIITIPLSGAVAHHDSTGGQGIVRAGEVQVMSAGSGVRHSEFNASESEPLSLFQIWIEPEANGVLPRYDQKTFNENGRKGEFQMLVSPLLKEKQKSLPDTLHIHQRAFISLGQFEAGHDFSYELHNTRHGIFLMVVDGRAIIGDQILSPRDALGVSEATTVSGTMKEQGKILLIEIPM